MQCRVSFVLLLCWVAVCAPFLGEGLLVEIKPNQVMCFVHHVDKAPTEIVVQYSTSEEYRSGAIDAVVVAPNGSTSRFDVGTRAPGLFSSSAPHVGEYRVCFNRIDHNQQTNEEAEVGATRAARMLMYIDIDEYYASDYNELDEQSFESSDVISKEYMPKFAALFFSLKGVNRVHNSMTYSREKFQGTVLSTYNRVIFMTVLNAVVLTASMLWQTRHIKRFFKEKKIV
jgi:hypothetical protein